MPLTRAEKERVTDSRLKVQSISESLKQVDPDKIPEIDQIENCLEHAEKNLEKALQS